MNRLIICILFLFLKCCSAPDLFSQNRVYYNNLKKDKKTTLAYSNKMLSTLHSSNKDQLDRLLLIKEQIRKRREILYIINREILLLIEEINTDESRISDLNISLESVKKEYAQLIYFSYLNMNIQRRMIYILSAENFNKAYKRIIYLKQLSDFRKKRSYQIERSIRTIDSTVNNLKNLKLEKESLVNEKSIEVDSLAHVKKELNKLIRNTKSRIDYLNAQVKTEQKKNKVIKQTVTKEISNQEANKRNLISKKSHKLEGNITKKFRALKRWHIWPLDRCVVLHHFGDYYHPELQHVIVKNDGIEIGSSSGKNVHSIYSGKVISIIPIPGDGTSIIVKHGDFYSVYSKVNNVKVNAGDVVGKGQVIARLGNNGKMTKMIFQLWYKKEKLNPELWLKKR